MVEEITTGGNMNAFDKTKKRLVLHVAFSTQQKAIVVFSHRNFRLAYDQNNNLTFRNREKVSSNE
jgi:hypothetical protein